MNETFHLLAEFMRTVWRLIGSVLSLEPAAFEVILAVERGSRFAVAVLFIAGVSDMVGQSFVLFANRVSRSRFVFSIMMAAFFLIITVFLWAASIWVIAFVVFGEGRSYIDVLRVVAISHAPLLFGFLILLPYLGNIIFHVLRVWVLLALLVGVVVTFEFALWQAIVCGLLGWFLLELLTRLPILQLERFETWWWRVATGRSELATTEDLADRYVHHTPARSRKDTAVSEE